jgi:hypothetical protein
LLFASSCAPRLLVEPEQLQQPIAQAAEHGAFGVLPGLDLAQVLHDQRHLSPCELRDHSQTLLVAGDGHQAIADVDVGYRVVIRVRAPAERAEMFP